MKKRRLIDIDKIKPIDFPSTEMDGLDVVRYLNTLPTVDAVEIVRCKDCKRAYRDKYSGVYFCRERQVRSEHFCSYGERKTDG